MNDSAARWALALMVVAATPVAGQTECAFRGVPEALSERPSPLDSVDFDLGGGWAKLCYGRPSTRGRVMVGGEEPYGTPWRMGANEPTTLHLSFPARVGTVDVDPGSYTLYAVPEAGSWTIVVNANTNRWGIPISPEVRSVDIGSFTVDTAILREPVETLTFDFEGGGDRGALVYRWERTGLRIPIVRR